MSKLATGEQRQRLVALSSSGFNCRTSAEGIAVEETDDRPRDERRSLAGFLRWDFAWHEISLVPCQIRSSGSSKVKHQGHFENPPYSREAQQTKSLIADLDRIVQIINVDVAAEEERAKVFDTTQPEYPILARALKARRDNLLDTIASLRQRLPKEFV
jgi:hypothetical protein